MRSLHRLLLDACRFDTGTENAGYLEHLIDNRQGAKYRVRGELPSMSRPMYETTLTGLPSSVHGITNNQIIRPSRFPNLFSLCRENGLTTAAAAYQWMSELYSRPGRFDPLSDRYQLEGEGSICHGIFYYEDQYPDTHLFGDGEFLRRTYHPDFLLFHSMNVDYWGHQRGSGSPEYAQAMAAVMEHIAQLLPPWLEEGWQVVITADHGMNAMGMHGGPTPEQRTVPLYIFSPKVLPGRFEDKEISQLNTAPLLCRLLDIKPAPGMRQSIEVATKPDEKVNAYD
ncbi:MAG: alkaline phosphatase family protein [Angelakisella sp.]|nr:alkaline phosphatase family protein [Angelakisella sp.]